MIRLCFLAITLSFVSVSALTTADLPTEVAFSTYLGSAFDHDRVTGVRIAADGTLIVAANVGERIYEKAELVSLPGFKPPAEARPVAEAFEDQSAYVDAAIAWVQRNVPGAPPVPQLEDEHIQQEIKERQADLTKKNRIERVPSEVIASARRAYAQKWSSNWAGGCVLRISADGQKVLSQLRIGPSVEDLHLDAEGNIYVAAGPNGVLSLKPDGITVRPGWPQLKGKVVRRVHASKDGHVIALVGEMPGTITIFDTNGKQITQRQGSRRTQDVAISTEDGLAYFTGYKVTRAPGQEGGEWRTYPVHIPYIKAFDYRTGEDVWKNYDWRGRIKLTGKVGTEGELPDDFLNRSTNNMADSRGVRITLGDDGKLYCAMEAAGGNHPMRWEPKDIMKPVGDKMAGGDAWHSFANTRASHKTVIGRYEAKTGELLKIQEFNTLVLEKGRFPSANALRLEDGDIAADSDGRLYLTGSAAFGLPIRFAPRFGNRADPPNFNPFDKTVPVKGAFLMIMSPDFNKRMYTTRLSPYGYGHSVHTRVVDGKLRVAWGGKATLRMPSYTHRALQAGPGWGEDDGFLAMLATTNPRGQFGDTKHRIDLLGEGLRTTSPTIEPERKDVNGDGKSDIVMHLPLDLTRSIAEKGELKISGGFSAQAINYGNRKVEYPKSFREGNGGILLDSVGARSNLSNEKHARVRSWMALIHEVQGTEKRLGFGRGDHILVEPEKHFGMSELRALIRNGDQWYISEQNLNEDGMIYFALDASDGRWAKFDPVKAVAADAPPSLLVDRLEAEDPEAEDPRYTEHNFNEITAVGLFAAGDWRQARRSGGRINGWSVTFAVDPVDDPAPVAVANVKPKSVERFAPVMLDASKSHDHGNELGFVRWKLGSDGGTTGLKVKHRFRNGGLQRVNLTVWDSEGATNHDLIEVSVYLEDMEVSARTQPIVSHVGDAGVKHFSIGGGDVIGDLKHRKLSLDQEVIRAPGGPLYGGFVTVNHKRPFYDFSSRSVGPQTRPLGFVAGKVRGKSCLLLLVRQDQFLSGADESGADLSSGVLHARGIKAGQVYWVLHTSKGWVVSQKPASARGNGAYHDEVSKITWLSYAPSTASGMVTHDKGAIVMNVAKHVDAMGMLLVMDGGEWQFGALGATGQVLSK